VNGLDAATGRSEGAVGEPVGEWVGDVRVGETVGDEVNGLDAATGWSEGAVGEPVGVVGDEVVGEPVDDMVGDEVNALSDEVNALDAATGRREGAVGAVAVAVKGKACGGSAVVPHGGGPPCGTGGIGGPVRIGGPSSMAFESPVRVMTQWRRIMLQIKRMKMNEVVSEPAPAVLLRAAASLVAASVATAARRVWRSDSVSRTKRRRAVTCGWRGS
jgi:hypothetical protein